MNPWYDEERGERVAEVAETASCARPGRRRGGTELSALSAFLLLLSTLVLVPLSSPARAQEAGTGSRTAQITVTDLSPEVPREGDTLTVRGTVTNQGTSPITGGRLAAREGVRLTSRSSIDNAVTRTGFQPEADGALVRGHAAELGTLRPGMSRPFALRIPVSDLNLGADGVYQLGVSLTGETEAEQWEQLLGLGRTLLPWQPDGQDPDNARTRLTALWPLISTTHVTARTDADEEQTPVLKDNSLLTEISPGGRLHQMVTLGERLPVTWVIDPDLLASVDAMTEEYQVETSAGLVAGQGQEAARAWLRALREAVRGSEVVALPFADPDLASLAHRGKDVPGALRQLRAATDMAGMTVQTVLGVEPTTDFAWPVEGAIDPDIVSVATSAGAHHIITRSDSIRPADGLSYTPSAARPIGGGTTAVVSDLQLSTLFQDDMTSAGSARLAHQQLLAQTLSITEQEPAKERSVVMAPQRMPTSTQARAMATALDTLSAEADWVWFGDLSAAAAADPDPAANHAVPGTDSYPEELREQELPVSAFQAMRETQRTLDDFQVILTRADRVATPFGNAVRRTMSTSWRGDSAAAARYRSSVQGQLVGLTEQVHLIQKSPITLSGRSATIPVTVQNNLVQGVEGLELRLTSSRRLGLEVGEPQPVSVSGGHSQSVKFSTTARANGRALLEAQLYTADGKPYGEPMRFHADVTSITSAVLVVIAGGVLLVVLAGIRMYSQRKRAGHRPAGEAATEEPEANRGGREEAAGEGDRITDEGDDSGRDTGEDRRAGPGPGEKLDR
ncbi:DUF6049 family protein [Streptomyces sodiiphilus]|uniref:DUF6049 family protein n=1 Tax=Streptomyces sodiiphilus TaxID=226217 RepID=A0ABN2PKH0_9ACTN